MTESSAEKSTGRQRVRHSLVVYFDSPAGKSAFQGRLEQVRSLLSQPGQPDLDNYGLMTAMFDLIERYTPFLPGDEQEAPVQSFNRNSGKQQELAS